MEAARRLRSVWQSRGALELCRFIASRLLSVRRDLIFEARTEDSVADPAWNGPGQLVVIDRHNVDGALSAATRKRLFDGEGRDYLRGIRNGALLFAVVDEAGELQHQSYVLFDTRTKHLLKEGREIPLFANCITPPAARGRHLYPSTLRYGLTWLGLHGYSRALINCDPENAASVSGIRRAGFDLLAETWTLVILGRVGLQRRRDRTGRASLRLYAG